MRIYFPLSLVFGIFLSIITFWDKCQTAHEHYKHINQRKHWLETLFYSTQYYLQMADKSKNQVEAPVVAGRMVFIVQCLYPFKNAEHNRSSYFKA